MFNSVYLYIILGLAASTASLGWLSVHNYRAKVEAESALVVAINVNTDMQKSLNLKDLSCKVDDASVAELSAEKNKIDEDISPINDQLKDLATVKKTPVIKSPTVKVNTNETIKNEVIFLPDDGLLSPNVKRLLNNGWCSVYPSTSQCVPAGQSAGKSM